MQESFFTLEEPHVLSAQYLPLARKYRPKKFSDMVGQPVLVQTITNAIINKRIPQAVLLTGIRGVGKTTTARIIAKAINCTGHDKGLTESIEPCGKCSSCVSIATGNHQDVLEIDAASNTGVNDIREIIENCRYKPVAGEFKFYIIDEVHMLSNSAFNALLKTLEEPPLHVKFIFATTEIRKIPLTILSRCQRFDLKRVDNEELLKHYKTILEQEGFSADEAALTIIANSAQGSVRDGLSMLDQALSYDGKNVTEDTVRKMLGLADKTIIFDLFSALVIGDLSTTMKLADHLNKNGAEPYLVAQDLLEILYNIARVKAVKNQNLFNLPEYEWNKFSEFATKLDMTFVTRCWQILLKGLEEIKLTSFPNKSLEMVLIRVAYASTLPSPEELLNNKSGDTKIEIIDQATISEMSPSNNNIQENRPPQKRLSSFEELVNLFYDCGEMMLYHHLINDVRLVSFAPQHLILKLSESAPRNFNIKIQEHLQKIYGETWRIEASAESTDSLTIAEIETQKESQVKDKIINNELVQGILNTFTGIEIADIKSNK